MLGFLSAPLGVAYHIVTVLAAFLSPLGASPATAVAIVLFTIGVRLMLAPLSFVAFRGQASMSELQPQVAELRKRYAHQPERLQRELTELYRAGGGGMLAGCLPLLLQLPFFSIMYRLFLSKTVGGRPNNLLVRNLFGTPLGSHWLSGAGPLSGHGLVFVGLLALLAGAAFLAARAAGRAASAVPSAPHVTPAAKTASAPRSSSAHAPARTVSARTASPPPASGRTAQALISQGQPAGLGAVTKVLPYTTVIIAAFVPLAAGLYLLTTTCWTLAERAVIRRLHARSRGPIAGSPTAEGPSGSASLLPAVRRAE